MNVSICQPSGGDFTTPAASRTLSSQCSQRERERIQRVGRIRDKENVPKSVQDEAIGDSTHILRIPDCLLPVDDILVLVPKCGLYKLDIRARARFGRVELPDVWGETVEEGGYGLGGNVGADGDGPGCPGCGDRADEADFTAVLSGGGKR
jgi:hypothetical protein